MLCEQKISTRESEMQCPALDGEITTIGEEEKSTGCFLGNAGRVEEATIDTLNSASHARFFSSPTNVRNATPANNHSQVTNNNPMAA